MHTQVVSIETVRVLLVLALALYYREQDTEFWLVTQ